MEGCTLAKLTFSRLKRREPLQKLLNGHDKKLSELPLRPKQRPIKKPLKQQQPRQRTTVT